MTIKELEDQVDLLSLIEKKYKTKRIGNKYRVDPCPVCGHHEHFTIYPDTNSYSSFNSCCNGGSVYKYLIEVEKMEEEEAYNTLIELSGISVSENSPKQKEVAPRTEPTKQVQEATYKDYTNLITSLYNIQTLDDKSYFINRGIKENVIEKYKLCIGSIKNNSGQRAILPTWINGKVVFYTGRAITEEQEAQRKYDNTTGDAPFFGLDNLKDAAGEVIIITEGIFDALSFESVGYKAIAMQGIKPEILKGIVEDHKDTIFLTALDNDKPGQEATQKISESLGLRAFKIPEAYKDINEWYTSDVTGFKDALEAQKRPDSLYNYMIDGLVSDIENYKGFKDRKTGFDNLDKITSLYPGLYVIGGLSTLGKTTFIHQMADQMAEMGEDVLFFSLEMAKLELITKSLARLTVKDNFDYGVTSLQIRLNDILEWKRPKLQEAIKEYTPISKRFNIIEGNFNTNITTIRHYVNDYILLNGVKPVVVIDYLQIIPGREKDRNDKERIDGVVTELKRISRDYNISVIVVSSLNRSNYLTPIDFESFKESGGIEYTADVIWGLQLAAINDDIFNSQAKIKEKREIINEAKKETPRKIELVCLKNRNGISNYRCLYNYYPKHDLFISEEEYKVEWDDIKSL